MSQIGDLSSKLEGAFSSITNITQGQNGQPGLFQRLDKLVADNGANITATIGNLHEITTKINSGQGTIGRLVNDPKMHDELVAAIEEIKADATQAKGFIANAQDIIDQVKSGQGALGTLVYNQEAGDNIKRVAQNVRELTRQAQPRARARLGRLINDGQPLYSDARCAEKSRPGV